MTHSPDRHPQGQDAQQLGAKHESGNSSENRGSMTTTSISDERLAEARAIVKRFYPEMPDYYSGRRVQIALEALTRSIPTDDAAVERAVMVCPQCDGEGGYPDGVDEAACHTDCTRCGSNGWIVDRAALTSSIPPATAPEEHPLAKMVALDEEFGLYDDESVPLSPTTAQGEVVQADREAASALWLKFQGEPYSEHDQRVAKEFRAGERDDDEFVEALRDHRLKATKECARCRG